MLISVVLLDDRLRRRQSDAVASPLGNETQAEARGSCEEEAIDIATHGACPNTIRELLGIGQIAFPWITGGILLRELAEPRHGFFSDVKNGPDVPHAEKPHRIFLHQRNKKSFNSLFLTLCFRRSTPRAVIFVNDPMANRGQSVQRASIDRVFHCLANSG
ncbi:MAG: hypothetical protein M3Q89_08285 [Verrucomicrobiota bacterium]|nr:hypothetical protein [Verrucomicrobiota bacterium]